MNKYQNGKMYKITNTVDDNKYVGSTCSSLPKRMINHKGDSKRYPNIKLYKHLLNIGWANATIELIENFPCNSKEELCKREQELINELEPTLNMYKSFGFDPKQYSTKYYQNNKVATKQKKDIRYTCECGSNIRTDEKWAHAKTNKHQAYLLK
jgi:hypothetical protein